MTKYFKACDINRKLVNELVSFYGWIKRVRKMGFMLFIEAYDYTGTVQLLIPNTNSDFEALSKLQRESYLDITGKVIIRKSPNKDLPNGDIEVEVSKVAEINPSALSPMIVDEQTDALEDVRFSYRYLDIRRKPIQNILRARSKFNLFIHNFFSNRNFVNIETPYLSKVTVEGAKPYLVESSIKNKYYALAQSPQIYKQLLMISGIDRYYQIARNFRNEDSRGDRQPEFTQLDLELTHVKADDIIQLVEDFVKSSFKEIFPNLQVVGFETIRYQDSMFSYGNDKPDLRHSSKINRAIFASNKLVYIHLPDGNFTRSEIDNIILLADQKQVSKLTWFKNNGGEITGPAAKWIDITKFDLSSAGITFVASESADFVANIALGKVRTLVLQKLKLLNPEIMHFVWVREFPLFEFNSETSKYAAAHHPFTMPVDVKDFDNPSSAIAQAYDLVLNGYEVAGGSIRINKPEVQQKMFETIGLNPYEIKEKFGYLLEAFKYGLPPHGGVAFGLDRLLMIAFGKESIREVIAFPKNSQGIDLMNNSPDEI